MGSLRGYWITALVLAMAVAPCLARDGFSIAHAELLPSDAGYVLNADVAYAFSPASIEALENGVPLTVAIRCAIDRERRYRWDERVVDYREKLEIRYHPLGKLFRMKYADHDKPQSFTSLSALLAAMGSIRGLVVIPGERVVAGERYRASLSIALDIEALPLPLRPIAYLSPSWYLGSPAYQWSFAKSD